MLEARIEKLIAWVEGRYIPVSEVEETELREMAEQVYPYLA